MALEFKNYKNRNGKHIEAVRLLSQEQMHEAYDAHLATVDGYSYLTDGLYKGDKKVAIGDYLVISENGTFTEVDGMFRQTYYPESFTSEQACLWLAAPTLILRNYDTAEEALEKLIAMNV